MSEQSEFDELIVRYEKCTAVHNGGCACIGTCLGSHLAVLRKKYDGDHASSGTWWSDQLHGKLSIRPGDSGRHGAGLTAENYWTGVR